MIVTPASIGAMVKKARLARQWTQQQLATALGTSQSAIHRIEVGNQNLSLEMIRRLAEALDDPLIRVKTAGSMNFRIEGGRRLFGDIVVRSSKNAAVALLCASLLNRGRTVLRGIAHIEEVSRLIEVLHSIGVKTRWFDEDRNLEIIRPDHLDLDNLDEQAATRTRSILMFLGPLMHERTKFSLPYAGGCDLGARTVHPHLNALAQFGLDVQATDGNYQATTHSIDEEPRVTLIERGDTVTENAIMAAAKTPMKSIIRNASGNYMVQDLCFFLQKLGIEIEGIGTTTLTIHGKTDIDLDIEYDISEDPIEAMSLLTLGIVTESQITVKRCAIEFLEVELAVLREMGQKMVLSKEYMSANGATRLVDIEVIPSKLVAPQDKVHPMPFPGLNIDNLPFFAVICACATGSSMIYDWVYESRIMHLLPLKNLGASVRAFDVNRLFVSGPTKWRGAPIDVPPALRPAVCILLAALAAQGETVLRNVYMINRGYEDLPNRLNQLGANISVFWEPDSEN